MASSGQSGSALGLQIAGLGAGLLGNALPTGQNSQDKAIANGQEDPALTALRKRLAAQNAQTAMAVAASQQGVNPALAQRNAQQALSTAQVQTNANLAQHNAQSTLASRTANRGAQHQQLTGTLLGAAAGLNNLGTGLGADAAQSAAAGAETVGGNAAPLTSPEAFPELGGQQQALQSALAQNGAGGLSPAVPSTLAGANGLAPAVPGTPIPNGTIPNLAAAPPALPAQPVVTDPRMEQFINPVENGVAGGLTEQGGPAQVTSTMNPGFQPTAAPQALAAPAPITEQQVAPRPVGQAPAGNAPMARAAPQAAAPQLTNSDRLNMIPTERLKIEDVGMMNAADAIEEYDPAMAERIRQGILNGLS